MFRQENFGTDLELLARVIRVGQEIGVGRAFFEHLARDPALFKSVAHMVCSPPSVEYDHRLVSRLLKSNFKGCGKVPRPIPGYLTFFDPGWSIERVRHEAGDCFSEQSWYDGQPFAEIEEMPRYRQLRMEARYINLCYFQQKQVIPPGDEVPLARVVIMGMTLHCLSSREKLFPLWVRCADRATDKSRVSVGSWGKFSITSHYDAYRGEDVGIVTVKS